MKEQLIKLQDSLAFEKQGRELYDEKTAKDLKNAEEVLEKILDEEKNVSFIPLINGIKDKNI